MPPKTVYPLINDELNLDSNSNLNIVSFVITWIESESDASINKTNGKNFVDNNEYLQLKLFKIGS